MVGRLDSSRLASFDVILKEMCPQPEHKIRLTPTEVTIKVLACSQLPKSLFQNLRKKVLLSTSGSLAQRVAAAAAIRSLQVPGMPIEDGVEPLFSMNRRARTAHLVSFSREADELRRCAVA